MHLLSPSPVNGFCLSSLYSSFSMNNHNDDDDDDDDDDEDDDDDVYHYLIC